MVSMLGIADRQTYPALAEPQIMLTCQKGCGFLHLPALASWCRVSSLLSTARTRTGWLPVQSSWMTLNRQEGCRPARLAAVQSDIWSVLSRAGWHMCQYVRFEIIAGWPCQLLTGGKPAWGRRSAGLG